MDQRPNPPPNAPPLPAGSSVLSRLLAALAAPSPIQRVLAWLTTYRAPLVRSARSLAVAFVIGLVLARPVLNRIVDETGTRIDTSFPIDPSPILLRIAFFFALGLTAPIVIYHFAEEIAPGRTSKSKWRFVGGVAAQVALFVAGALVALSAAASWILALLLEFWGNRGYYFDIDLEGVFLFFLTVMVGFGLLAPIPATVLVLAKLRLIRPATTRSVRRIAIPILVAVAALITMSEDVISLAIVALPLSLAFELGIVLSLLFAFPSPGAGPLVGDGAPPDHGDASTLPDCRGPMPSRPRRLAEP